MWLNQSRLTASGLTKKKILIWREPKACDRLQVWRMIHRSSAMTESARKILILVRASMIHMQELAHLVQEALGVQGQQALIHQEITDWGILRRHLIQPCLRAL